MRSGRGDAIWKFRKLQMYISARDLIQMKFKIGLKQRVSVKSKLKV